MESKYKCCKHQNYRVKPFSRPLSHYEVWREDDKSPSHAQDARKGKGDHLPRKGGEKRRRRRVWLDAGRGHTLQLNFSPPPL